MTTLVIDIGGTGIKMIVLDDQGAPTIERDRVLTPQPATPDTVLPVVASMIASKPHFDRVSVGFPGVVRARGVVSTAPNLSTPAWAGRDLGEAIRALTDKPVRVYNDADLQGYGVIRGQGVEMAITLGTGLGTALFTGGRLVPNLELGHHPWDSEQTYEQYVSNATRRAIGKKQWRPRVTEVLQQLMTTFSLDHLWIGGGNAKALKAKNLIEGTSLFTNVEGLKGGVRLWELEAS